MRLMARRAADMRKLIFLCGDGRSLRAALPTSNQRNQRPSSIALIRARIALAFVKHTYLFEIHLHSLRINTPCNPRIRCVLPATLEKVHASEHKQRRVSRFGLAHYDKSYNSNDEGLSGVDRLPNFRKHKRQVALPVGECFSGVRS